VNKQRPLTPLARIETAMQDAAKQTAAAANDLNWLLTTGTDPRLIGAVGKLTTAIHSLTTAMHELAGMHVNPPTGQPHRGHEDGAA
jgi:hypothetical protein